MGNTRDTGYLRNIIAYDASGNVGIGGAASGSYKLQVTGATNLTGALAGTSATFSNFVTTIGCVLVPVPGFPTPITTNGIYLSDTNTLSLSTNTTNRLTITSAGNVGIATTSPTNLTGYNNLSIQASSIGSNLDFLTDMGGRSAAIVFNTAVSLKFLTIPALPIIFEISSNERMRISSTGNVGIGTSSPNLENYGTELTLSRTSGGQQETFFNIQGSRTDDGTVGGINFFNGSNKIAYIRPFRTSADNSGALAFYTNNAGSSGERMRITSTGRVELKTEGLVCQKGMSNSVGGGSFLAVSQTGSTEYWYLMQLNAAAGLDFWSYNTQWNVRATLSSAGVWSSVGGGTSDRRTKQNIEYIESSGLDAINLLKPTKFQFKSCPEKTRRGFIAQDVLEVIPDLVLGDGENKNGTYGLDYDGILALAVKAIQELKAEIDLLKAK